MYKQNSMSKTRLKGVESYVAETLEQKVHRIINNKEPIKDGAPVIFTDRKDGVQPSYNIRTDRFEVAVEAMDKVSRSKIARRENSAKVVPLEKKDGKSESAGNEGVSTESSQ